MLELRLVWEWNLVMTSVNENMIPKLDVDGYWDILKEKYKFKNEKKHIIRL